MSEKQPEVIIPSAIDIEFACNADMNTKWRAAGKDYTPPAQRTGIREALIAPSREISSDDMQPISNN